MESTLLRDLINKKYEVKNRFIRERMIRDDWKRRLVQSYIPIIEVIEKNFQHVPEQKAKNMRNVISGADEKLPSYTGTEEVHSDPLAPEPPQPISESSLFLPEDDMYEFNPDKTVRERFAESTLETRDEMMEQLPALARPYIEMLLNDDVDLDSTYGVRLNEDNELQIGNAFVEIDPTGGDILLYKDVTDEVGRVNKRLVGEYEGTSGLYSLLFTRNPSYYSQEDKENYHKILNASDAIKNARVGVDKGTHKFKTIIREFVSASNIPSPRTSSYWFK